MLEQQAPKRGGQRFWVGGAREKMPRQSRSVELSLNNLGRICGRAFPRPVKCLLQDIGRDRLVSREFLVHGTVSKRPHTVTGAPDSRFSAV